MKLKVIFGILALLTALTISCQSNESLDFTRYYAQGRIIYQIHCQNCHDASGKGLNGLIPPLTDSVYLKANLHRLPCFVQNGVSEKITVASAIFTGKMPANSDLANIDVAEVLTYITNSFGNKLGMVNVETVNQDIQNCK